MTKQTGSYQQNAGWKKRHAKAVPSAKDCVVKDCPIHLKPAALPNVPGDHSECGPDCVVTGDACDGSHAQVGCSRCGNLTPVPPETSPETSNLCSDCSGLDALLEQIAKEQMRIPSLKTQNRDADDFFEVAVWDVRSALLAAYRAGQAKGTGK